MTRTIPLDEVDTDDLINIPVGTYTNDELMSEQERCQEVIDLHVMTGDDLSYWFDRVVLIETMRHGK